jgi:hypothetical protein
MSAPASMAARGVTGAAWSWAGTALGPDARHER